MDYIITFLEGLISFISPCMLPMLPLYISYFAAGTNHKGKVLLRAGCFVLGFTLVFSAMGLFAGSLGSFLNRYQTAVNIVSGGLIILFGLMYLEIIRIPLFKGMEGGRNAGSAISAFLFGVVYSVSLTPCVGAFLGSALMMASAAGTAVKGLTLLVTYSLGLGVPFLISAVLIQQLSGAFNFIKRHYKTINLVCGIFLIVVGVVMALGGLNYIMALFS